MSVDGIVEVLFDVDGTLLDHRSAAAAAVKRIAAAAWVADAAGLVEVWQALEERHLDAYLAGRCSFAEQRRRRLREFLPLLDAEVGDDEALDAWFAHHYLPAYQQAWRAYPDVAPCLERLATLPTRPRLAVLTNGDTGQQHAKLSHLGLAEHVHAIVTSAALGVAKPDPRAFTLTCDRLHVPADAAVHVGDRLDMDAIAARDAGMTGVWLDRNSEAGPLRDAGVPRISSLTDLTDLLEDPSAAPRH